MRGDDDENEIDDINTEVGALYALDDFLTNELTVNRSTTKLTMSQERRHGRGFAFKVGPDLGPRRRSSPESAEQAYVLLNLDKYDEDSEELEDLIWTDEDKHWGVFRPY